MNAQELLLRISGDSTGGQQAVGGLEDRLKSLQSTSSAVQSTLDELSTGAQSWSESLKTALASPVEFIKGLGDGVKEELGPKISSVWDDIATRSHNAVSEMGETLGKGLESAIEHPMEVAKGAILGTLETLGPFGVGVGAIGTAAAVAGKELFDLAEEAAGVGESIRSFSLITGQSVASVERLRSIADLAGSSLDQMRGLGFKLEQQMLTTGAAQEKFRNGLADLNIDFNEFAKADLTGRVLMLSEGLQKGANSGDNLKAVVEVLTARGKEYVPVLTKINEALVAQADTVKLTLGEKDVENAEKFEVQLNKLKEEVGNFKTMVGNGLIVPITYVLKVVDAAGKALPWILGAATAPISIPAAALSQVVSYGSSYFSADNIPELKGVKSNLDGGLPMPAGPTAELSPGTGSKSTAGDKAIAAIEKTLTADVNAKIKQEEAAQKWADSEATIADRLQKMWGTYYQFTDKAAGDSLQAKLAADATWYNTEYDAIAKLASKNKDAWGLLDGLNAAYYAKMVADTKAAYQQDADIVQKWADAITRGTEHANKIVLQSNADTARAIGEGILSNLKVEADADSKMVSMAADTYQAKSAAIDAWAQHEYDKIDYSVGNWEAAADRIGAATAHQYAILDQGGYMTRDQLRQVADDAIAQYARMRDSGLFTAAEVQEAWLKAQQAILASTDSFSAHFLASLQTDFASFPDMLIKAFEGGGGLDGAMKAFGIKLAGQLQSAIGAAMQSGAAYAPQGPIEAGADASSLGVGKSGNVWGQIGTTGKTTTAWQMAGAGAGVIADLSDNPDTKAGQYTHDISKGAQIGTMILPGWGTAIGAGVGAIVAAFSEDPAYTKAKEDQAHFFDGLRASLGPVSVGMSNYDVLIKTVAHDMADMGKNGEEQQKVLSNLLNTSDPDKLAQGIKDANVYLQQEAAILPGVKQGFADLNQMVQSGITDQGTYNLVAQSAVELFGEYIKKTGDVIGGLQQLQPTFDALKQGQTDFGLAGSEAIAKLMKLNDVAEANKPLLNQIQTTTAMMKDLQDASTFTKDDFVMFGQQAFNQFTNLTKATGSQGQALALMQPELQQLWEAQKRYGTATDANTAAMIKQAEEAGIVGAQQEDVNNQILDVLLAIANVFGADLPAGMKATADAAATMGDTVGAQAAAAQKALDAAAGAASSVGDAINRIPSDKRVAVHIDTTTSDNGGGGGGDNGGGGTGGYWRGGVVGAQYFKQGGRVAYLDTGGSVSPWGMPQGTDTVRAWLTPREMVITEDQQAMLGTLLKAGTPSFSGGALKSGLGVAPTVINGPANYSLQFVIPPGTNVNDPQALALALQNILRTDWAGTRTAVERIADQRIAAAAPSTV